MIYNNAFPPLAAPPQQGPGELANPRWRSVNAQRLTGIRRPTAPQPLSREEFEKILESAEKDASTHYLKDIVQIIYHTGIRPQHLAALRWSDVDLERRYMRVSFTATQSCLIPFGNRILQLLKIRRDLDPSAEFVFGKSPRSALASAQLDLAEISRGLRPTPITLDAVRQSFLIRWLEAGGNKAQLECITNWSTRRLDPSRLIAGSTVYREAAKFQSQLEDSE